MILFEWRGGFIVKMAGEGWEREVRRQRYDYIVSTPHLCTSNDISASIRSRIIEFSQPVSPNT